MLLLSGVAFAQSVDTTLQVQCAGRADAKVTIRWGHPDYSTNEYISPFSVPCNTGLRETHVTLLYRDSQFEVQTEGGIQTSYVVKATLHGAAPNGNGSIELDHASSTSLSVNGSGFSVDRSSGPNRYGEQNFRVSLPPNTAATARVVAQSFGTSGNTQMALRWGHPDFHDSEYFPLWTVKPGATQEKTFRLAHGASEFEIQTEGGEGTGYQLSIWLDTGSGMSMQPSIQIVHGNHGTNVLTAHDNVRFDAGKGNVYGETNVGVMVPALPPENTKETTNPRATGGINILYHWGEVPISTTRPDPITIRYAGKFIEGSSTSTQGKTVFQTDVPNQALNTGPRNDFSDGESGLRPGSWNIQVGTVANGQFFDITSCTVQVMAGKAPFINVNRPTRNCP